MSARKVVASFVAMVAVLAVTERPGAFTARGERLAAFDERGIPGDGVAPHSNTGGILTRRALSAGRSARLGATRDFHHGLSGLEPQGQVRDLRPGEARPASRREIELLALLATTPPSLALYGEIAKLQEDRGALREAEATHLAARSALPTWPGTMTNLAYFYNRTGQFDQAVAALEDAATLSPSDAAVLYLMATFYQQRVQSGRDLDSATRLAYIRAGIRATDRTLLLVPEHIDALTVRSVLLRQDAMTQTDATARGQLIAEADQTQARATELRKARTMISSNGSPVTVRGVETGIPHGDPAGVVRPQAGGVPDPTQSGYPSPMAPVRVGGNIKTPTKILDVRAVYPPEAQIARISGVVIIELTIDAGGAVQDAKVLRSVPMLDQAAVDAVRQWLFTPTMLNGVAVPVIMTVTVNFTMQK